MLIGWGSWSQLAAGVAPRANIEVPPLPRRIWSHRRIRNPSISLQLQPTGIKTAIPRVDTAPHGVEPKPRVKGRWMPVLRFRKWMLDAPVYSDSLCICSGLGEGHIKSLLSFSVRESGDQTRTETMCACSLLVLRSQFAVKLPANFSIFTLKTSTPAPRACWKS